MKACQHHVLNACDAFVDYIFSASVMKWHRYRKKQRLLV